MSAQNQIVIYHDKDSGVTIDVKLEGETIWLDQYQLETLFDTDRTSIGRHLRNIYSTNELDKEATSAKIAQVQKEGDREVTRKINVYNLDAILSIGYRVNSKKGTAFRIWANTILKDYVKKGFAINEKLLKEKTQQLQELKSVIKLQEKVLTAYHLEANEAEGLIKVIANYSDALDILDDYDHQRLQLPKTDSKEVFQIHYQEARKAIDALGKQTEFKGLFGREKDDSFKSSLGTIYQTFGGEDLYSSIEEKAAHLLYFVVKNHSFTDGNKRIAAFLFVWFLERNKLLYNAFGAKRMADSTLVALTLMIAESHPKDKDMIIKVVVNLLVVNE
jgi:prophage maintenance system killer protein